MMCGLGFGWEVSQDENMAHRVSYVGLNSHGLTETDAARTE